MATGLKIDGAFEAPSDTTEPIPPRFWWLKRIAIMLVVLLAALIGVRLWWGRVADTRLQAAIEKYRSAGQPVYPSDFDPEPVADEENSARVLQDGEAAVSLTPDQQELIATLSNNPAACNEHLNEILAVVQANAKALDLVRRSRLLLGVDWGLRLRSPVSTSLLPSLAKQRQLAKLTGVAAIYRHHTGDDRASIEILRDLLSHGETIDKMRGMLIGHLVAIAILGGTTSTIEYVAPNLRVAGTGEFAASADAPASRRQVQALIADLLEEESIRDGWRYGLYGARTCTLDWALLLSRGKLDWSTMSGAGPATPPVVLLGVGSFFGPMAKLDAVRAMERTTFVAEAGVEAGYPAAAKRLPGSPLLGSGVKRITRIFSDMMLPSFDRALVLHFRVVAARRMAAVALAIRLYELEHGHRPETLAQLVPEYLSAVPGDPFAENDRPIAYRLDVGRTLLYSVGIDGIDDGGAYAKRDDGNIDSEVKDTPFFLNGDRPRSTSSTQPASTQAVDKNRKVEGEYRQSD